MLVHFNVTKTKPPSFTHRKEIFLLYISHVSLQAINFLPFLGLRFYTDMKLKDSIESIAARKVGSHYFSFLFFFLLPPCTFINLPYSRCSKETKVCLNSLHTIKIWCIEWRNAAYKRIPKNFLQHLHELSSNNNSHANLFGILFLKHAHLM